VKTKCTYGEQGYKTVQENGGVKKRKWTEVSQSKKKGREGEDSMMVNRTNTVTTSGRTILRQVIRVKKWETYTLKRKDPKTKRKKRFANAEKSSFQ